MVIDVFTYNGEKDVLDLHLHCLNKYVDKFIIVEAKTTFSGYKKPLYFMRDESYFQRFWHKISYHIIKEKYSEERIALAESSPNTRGARHWKNEFLQKESIKDALVEYKVKDDDIVYIGDVDEIWSPYEGFGLYEAAKLKLRVYAYYLNNRSSEEFWGTVVAPYSYFKDKCLNHVRSDQTLRTSNYYGWHFTSMGGVQEVRRKLNDSYTPDSYNTYVVQELLPQRVEKGIDYLGRPFDFTLDESEWPEYLQDNKSFYQRLCKTSQLSSVQ